MKIVDMISHVTAYGRAGLRSKRMGNKMPNGNIIVDQYGRYNRFDAGAHQYKFSRIKERYAVGSESESRMLTTEEIWRLAPGFVKKLPSVLGIKGTRPIDIISRKGRILTAAQVRQLLAWLPQ